MCMHINGISLKRTITKRACSECSQSTMRRLWLKIFYHPNQNYNFYGRAWNLFVFNNSLGRIYMLVWSRFDNIVVHTYLWIINLLYDVRIKHDVCVRIFDITYSCVSIYILLYNTNDSNKDSIPCTTLLCSINYRYTITIHNNIIICYYTSHIYITILNLYVCSCISAVTSLILRWRFQ